MQVLIVFTFVALALQCSGVAGVVFQCYNCAGKSGSACDSPIAEMARNCSFGTCLKLETDFAVVRTCGPAATCMALDNDEIPIKHLKRCSACHEDLCNPAPSIGINALLFYGVVGAMLTHLCARQWH